MTKWLITFDAIDPKNPLGGSWKVGVPPWLYRVKQVKGDERACARLILVKEVLEGGTTRLYEGWSRPEKDDCFVYVGRPKKDHKSLSIVTPAPPGMHFLVFVLPDGSLDDWTWRESAETDSDASAGVNGRLLWPLNPI